MYLLLLNIFGISLMQMFDFGHLQTDTEWPISPPFLRTHIRMELDIFRYSRQYLVWSVFKKPKITKIILMNLLSYLFYSITTNHSYCTWYMILMLYTEKNLLIVYANVCFGHAATFFFVDIINALNFPAATKLVVYDSPYGGGGWWLGTVG